MRTVTTLLVARVSLSVALAVALALPGAAATIREFPANEGFFLVAGADGALWFTIGGESSVGRISTTGAFKKIWVPADGVPMGDAYLWGLSAGAGGNLWIAAPGRRALIRFSPEGISTEFPTPGQYPYFTARGPDGNIWYTAVNAVGRLTPAGQVTAFPVPAFNGFPGGIVAGPDGNLWFAERRADRIARITPQGQITEFPLPNAGSNPLSITVGLDGALWFTEPDGNRIGRITTGGVVTEYDLPHPGSEPLVIVQGPDNALWFTEVAGRIGRVTTDGVITELTIPTPDTHPVGLAVGADGNLWFTENFGYKVGRVTLGDPGSAPCVPGDTVLCIDHSPGDRRFRVVVEYATAQAGGLSGFGHATSLTSLGVNRGGLFWFFSQDNPEFLVKVLDGCSTNGRRWVFASAGTNVGLILSVADTVSGEVHTYYNLDLTPFAPVQDVRALACDG